MRVIDLLENGMKRSSARWCVIDPTTRLTHADVLAHSHRVAAGLHAAGLRRGSKVAIFSPNQAYALVAMIGLFRAGCVWLPVQTRNPIPENIEFLNENRCEFIFYHGSLAGEIDQIRRAVPTLKGLVCLDEARAEAPLFTEWAARFPDQFPDDAHGAEDLAWIKGTGGTTGKPKSVMICQRNAGALFANFGLCMPLPGPHINLAAAPITHGAGNIALCCLFNAGAVVLIDKPDPTLILDAIEEHGVTTLFLPPTVTYSLLEDPTIRRRKLSSVKYFISAAAPIAASKLQLALEIFGTVLCQAWGQTEAPLICTYLGPHEYAVNDPEILTKRLRSCGKPSPLTRVAVMDDDGRLLADNEVGELVVQGDLVMHGYYERPAENAAASAFGWHHTGDVGYRDTDGYYYIVDRKKDMIISGGFNIYPSEIEQVLWRHPAVLDCAVVGVPDVKWGEAVKAVVELKAGAAATEDEIRQHCRASLGGMKTPKSVEFWPTLPRSAVGKVLKKDIRERFWQGQERRV